MLSCLTVDLRGPSQPPTVTPQGMRRHVAPPRSPSTAPCAAGSPAPAAPQRAPAPPPRRPTAAPADASARRRRGGCRWRHRVVDASQGWVVEMRRSGGVEDILLMKCDFMGYINEVHD